MLEGLLLVALGAAVGTLGTLVGAGGGFLLVPLLLLIYDQEDPGTITAMSLAVVSVNATSGSLAYARQRRIDYYTGAWFAVATLPCAIAGSFLVQFIDRRTFAGLFAGVLGGVAVYLALRRPAAAIREPLEGRGVVTREIRDQRGQRFRYAYRLWQGIAISAGIGLVSSLLGVGGGVLHVPIMATVLHFPVHVATATSQFVLAFMALQATVTHVLAGNLGWDESLARAGLLAAGAIPGAQAGARLARRLKGDIIVRVLAGALLLVALRLGLTAAGV